MRKLALLLLILPVLSAAITTSDIVKASSNLKSVKCLIRAENHVGARKSVVEFWFYYERNGQKMRIEYTYPRNMKGAIVAIDGEYFYNYIPSLRRKIKKPLGKSTKNPGKDMGLMYDYVLGDLDVVFSKWSVEISRGKDVWILEMRNGEMAQKVWLDEKTLFPTRVEVYKKGKLKVVLVVKEYEINPKLDEGIFKPF